MPATSSSQTSAAERLRRAAAKGWELEPLLTPSQWADRYRRLSSVDSSEYGQWSTDRTPYLREIMDVMGVSDPTREMCFVKGTQLGGTAALMNVIGYGIDAAPGPMLWVLPSESKAKDVSKQRLKPMIAETPALRGKLSDATRDSSNTILVREFTGGILMMTGANTAVGLKSAPIGRLLCDEVDEFPDDVEGQGDPIDLARARTETFKHAKIGCVSSPTIRGRSKIMKLYEASDRRRYMIPCPWCGHADFLTWNGFADYHEHTDDGHHRIAFDGDSPETVSNVRMVCGSCAGDVDESSKKQMLERGEWVATAPGPNRIAGFHLSALYSPWKKWVDCVVQFLKAKSNPLLLKVWVNTVLAETWEDRGEGAREDSILGRLEEYSAEVPEGVGILVAAVDVQGDRLEYQVKGYGAGEESWLIDYGQIDGDPANDSTWLELDREVLLAEYEHPKRKVSIECATVDSGGHHTEQVYLFCKLRRRRTLPSGVEQRVLAVRGGNLSGLPLVGRPTRTNSHRIPLYTLCTDTGKQLIYSRLKIRELRGAGVMHFPSGGLVDAEYAAQMTAERGTWKWSKAAGRSIRNWTKMRERNEVLDLENYSLAALYIAVKTLEDLEARVKAWAVTPESPPAPDPGPPSGVRGLDSLIPRPRRGGWVGGLSR